VGVFRVIAIRNDRGEEVARQVVNVGALQGAESAHSPCRLKCFRHSYRSRRTLLKPRTLPNCRPFLTRRTADRSGSTLNRRSTGSVQGHRPEHSSSLPHRSINLANGFS